MTMPRIIINGDDFGWTDGHNQAVAQAHQQGILNRASLMTVGDAFTEAVELSQQLPDLGIGVHLVLNEANPILPAHNLAYLTRSDGTFYERVGDLLLLWLRGRLSSQAAENEWRAQIERALRAGVNITHLNGHKHVHVLPPLRQAIVKLAKQYGIPYVRLPLEQFTADALRRTPGWFILWILASSLKTHLLYHNLYFASRFFGIATSGAMTTSRLFAALDKIREGETAEIMVHPAVITPAVLGLKQRYQWARTYQFEEELRGLCDQEVVTRFQQKITQPLA